MLEVLSFGVLYIYPWLITSACHDHCTRTDCRRCQLEPLSLRSAESPAMTIDLFAVPPLSMCCVRNQRVGIALACSSTHGSTVFRCVYACLLNRCPYPPCDDVDSFSINLSPLRIFRFALLLHRHPRSIINKCIWRMVMAPIHGPKAPPCPRGEGISSRIPCFLSLVIIKTPVV